MTSPDADWEPVIRLTVGRPPCPRAHAADVDRLAQWEREAAAMTATHVMRQCPTCGVRPVWVRKPGSRRRG